MSRSIWLKIQKYVVDSPFSEKLSFVYFSASQNAMVSFHLFTLKIQAQKCEGITGLRKEICFGQL